MPCLPQNSLTLITIFVIATGIILRVYNWNQQGDSYQEYEAQERKARHREDRRKDSKNKYSNEDLENNSHSMDSDPTMEEEDRLIKGIGQ